MFTNNIYNNHGFCQGSPPLSPNLKLKFPLVAFSPLKYLNIFGVPLSIHPPLELLGNFIKPPLINSTLIFRE